MFLNLFDLRLWP